MELDYYVVDAFASTPFEGNPAGVCVLTGEWPSPACMQKIAAENRLSETAFVKRREDGSYDLRFYSPGSEVGLCGHATLGTTFVLSNFVDPEAGTFHYHTRDEEVSATKTPEGRYALCFPAWIPVPRTLTPEISKALNGLTPTALFGTRDLIAVFDDEDTVRAFVPDQEAIAAATKDYLGLLITAPAAETDYVDRSFFPNIDIPEDPVCGSAKCSLIPLWSEQLGKDTVIGRQLSERTGTVYGRRLSDTVEISGYASLYLHGTITI